MFEKIKEKRTNIKHLLYLSGNNLASYWMGFYITDYIKLLIFTILLIIPLYTINGCATYFASNLLIINISSLSFVYFITFFCSKDSDGAKVLFTFIFSFIVIIVAIGIVLSTTKTDIDFIDIYQVYIPNVFDITPITSMAFSFIRLIISYSIISEFKKIFGDRYVKEMDTQFKTPEEYLATSYIAQLLNIVFYTLLLLLAESGLLGSFIHCLHQICYADKDVKTQPLGPIMPASPVLVNDINQNVNNNPEYSENIRSINSINGDNEIIETNGRTPLMEKPTQNNNYMNNNSNIINTNSNIVTNQYNNQIMNNQYNNQIMNNQYNNQIMNNQYNNQIMNNQYNNNQIMGNQYNNQIMNNQYNNNQIMSNQYNNQFMGNQYNNINNNQYMNSQIVNNQYGMNQNPSPPFYQKNLDFNFNGENLSGNPLLNPYVQSEMKKVSSQQELTTRIINLTKTFYPCCACCREGKVRAINHLYLGLEPNEKFGLLGFNGSGKTTTFKAITNEIRFDCGSINLFGYDSKRDFNRIRTIIGYCPQINPLFDFMKVKEIIQFYSQLKTCNENAEIVCQKFGLSKYMDTYTVNLSGGNKRKLTFAIAMMNKPTLLLLDEPSTGVDPESRRIMWRNINELSNSGHRYNMVLTTHSMEEAEILCDTVSWLRNGNFITLGNPEVLKLKYSAGYKLHIKFVESIIYSQKISTTSNIEQNFNIICSLIEGFNLYSSIILSNPSFDPYLIALINVIQKIRDKTKKIFLYSIGKDNSFEFVLQIINERKKDLFSQILNMKNVDNSIDELTISMQSLENILTSI